MKTCPRLVVGGNKNTEQQVKVKVKVKFILEHDRKVQRRSTLTVLDGCGWSTPRPQAALFLGNPRCAT